jgi:hypothetical protein
VFNQPDQCWQRFVHLCNQKKNSTYELSNKRKLCKLACKLKNSPTILLPMWYKTLTAHWLPPHMMPHDVSTCWNSTFDMLEFAIKYHTAIDTMTRACNFGLHQYELAPAEWKITSELWHVLKVRILLSFFFFLFFWIQCYLTSSPAMRDWMANYYSLAMTTKDRKKWGRRWPNQWGRGQGGFTTHHVPSEEWEESLKGSLWG